MGVNFRQRALKHELPIFFVGFIQQAYEFAAGLSEFTELFAEGVDRFSLLVCDKRRNAAHEYLMNIWLNVRTGKF
ncbi:MAG: hypothetical protein CMQ44_04820 [Gammaproteobacteria bacterium]|nr:hypothetical protein [Gammaproteobacteria bacterium]